MNRLHAIAARRAELLRDVEAARQAAREAVNRAREWMAPMSLGIAAGQILTGRGWLRAAAFVSAAIALVCRWRRR